MTLRAEIVSDVFVIDEAWDVLITAILLLYDSPLLHCAPNGGIEIRRTKVSGEANVLKVSLDLAWGHRFFVSIGTIGLH